MYRFTNDYNELAHSLVLSALTNQTQSKNGGYGLDEHCQKAADKIKQLTASPNSHVHFFVSGTITNLTFISHILKPYHAVIAASTGHIAVHEAGAIEATGHKVITVNSLDGKLTPEQIIPVLDEHCDEHMVIPKLIYISQTTEIGTVYTKKELQTLFEFCKKHHLYLFLDGARLAMGLASDFSDITFEDLAHFTDAFYIGGTKVGVIYGEALVIHNNDLNADFRHNMKQRGAIMAKSWTIGLQFLALLKDNLYYKLGKHSNLMAQKVKKVLESFHFTFDVEVQSNQIFVNIPDEYASALTANFKLLFCGKKSNNTSCYRFVTSWSTKDEDIEQLEHVLKSICK